MMAALGWISFFVCLSCLLVVLVVGVLFYLLRSSFRSMTPSQQRGHVRDGAIEADYELIGLEKPGAPAHLADSDLFLTRTDDPNRRSSKH